MSKKNKSQHPIQKAWRTVHVIAQKNNKVLQKFLNKDPRIKRGSQILGSLALVLVMVFSVFLFQVNDRFASRSTIVTISPSDTATMISYKLYRSGIISNILGFRVIAKVARIENRFHAGEYKLSGRMNLWKVLNTLQEKGALSMTSGTTVTIPEGYTLDEIADILQSKGICTKKDFLHDAYRIKTSYLAEKYPYLKTMTIEFPEGYLFPDTYILPQNASPNHILDIMIGRFDRVIQPLMPEIKRNRLTLHQIITLASIVERETANRAERRLIAGVYMNRLTKVIHLGSCPTVKYALGKPRQPYLLYTQLNVRSPYNTYRHYGLPPGPIGSPGYASIMAALRPEQTDYLYFVSKGDGTHVFTTTLKDHLEMQKEIEAKNEGKIY